MALRFDAVVGGGIIGVSSALHLAERGLRVAIADPRPLMSLTSARSTECYRDLWDSPVMSCFVRASIDGMERRLREVPGAFAMFPRGAVGEQPKSQSIMCACVLSRCLSDVFDCSSFLSSLPLGVIGAWPLVGYSQGTCG
jgi:hypothetical protein